MNSSDPGRIFLSLALGAAAFIAMSFFFPKGVTPEIGTLGLAIGWGGSLLIGLMGLAVVYRMFTGSIDLRSLLCEPDGKASIARFQLLVFTFVISLSLLVIIVSAKDGPTFPEKIPPEILGLLGISAGSYVISKSLQNNNAGADSSTSSTANPAAAPAAGNNAVTSTAVSSSASTAALSIALAPASLSLIEGQSATLAAAAAGPGPLSFEWQRGPAGSADWQVIAGQNQSTLSLTPRVDDDGSQYRCKVSNPSASLLSAAVPLSVAADRG